MDKAEIQKRLLAHRHILSLLLSDRSNFDAELDALTKSAELVESHRTKPESAASYRDEIDRIGAAARLLQNAQK
ncbi:MAG: hypothetical protein V4610_01730 [Pseudomonadota bacterium]|jgi:hypothetical protein